MLLTAADIGRANGLRYVYAGNLPGSVGDLEDTRCASCGELLISRYGYHIRDYRLTAEGRCPSCAARLPGRFSPRFDGQITSRPFVPGSRRFTILTPDARPLGRPLRNLRLSVTDRCNLRCEYCMRRRTTSGCRARTCCTSRKPAPSSTSFWRSASTRSG